MSGEAHNSIERQRALWRISAGLADARLDGHDSALNTALRRAGRALDVAAVGVWSTDLVERVTDQTHLWMAEDCPPAVRDDQRRPLGEEVAAQMFANEGIAVMPLDQLAGDRTVADGWQQGVGILALIDYVGDHADTVGLITRDPAFAPEDIEFIQVFATILRQYFARIRIERDLEKRLKLEAFIVRCVADLGSVSAPTLDATVERVLSELVDRLGLQTAAVFRIEPDKLRCIQQVGEKLPDQWMLVERPVDRPFDVPDSTLTTVRLHTVASGLFGAAQDLVAADDQSMVTFLPSGVGAATRESVVFVHPERPWDLAELEATRLIAPAIVQNRIRVEAELLSEYREAVQLEFASVAADFLRVEPGQVDEVVREGLRRVSTRLGASLAVVFAVDGEQSGTGRVDAVWAAGPDPYAPGDSVAHTRTAMARVLRSGEPFGAVLPVTSGLLPSVRELIGDADCWTTVAAPLIGDPEPSAVAVLLPGDHGHRLETIVELLSAFGDLLAQLRVRLRLESELEREAAAQALLRRSAATLAESDDFDTGVELVLRDVAAFFELDELTSWQVDAAGERFVVRHTVGAADEVGTELSFGIDLQMDEARSSAEVCCVDDASDIGVLTSLAVGRGGGALEAVLTAVRGSVGIDGIGCRTLHELSSILERMEERVANERYQRSAFGAAPVGIVLCDRDWRIITCNPAFAEFCGRTDPQDMVGLDHRELFDLDGDYPVGSEELPLVGRDGMRVWARSHATEIEGVTGDESLWLVHVEDITARRRGEQLLRFQATHDELTGLANRRRLNQELQERLRTGETAAVLILDLDRFKNINDTLGHDRGDELLVVIADRLRLLVRPGDMVVRLGGDEFAVLLYGPGNETDARSIADRFLRVLREPVALGGQVVFPSASIGIAICDGSATVEEVVRRADTAMYRAKSEGRNRHATFDDAMREQVTQRLAIETGLRHALRRQELEVHYQPEVVLPDGRIVGAEALIRWRHPEQGLLEAGRFIEVAEETGIITEIGEFVLFEACREAASWNDERSSVRVNFAAAQLQQVETVELVSSALGDSRLAASRLCVEITESAMMDDVQQAEEVLRRLKALGVRIAVDDFGTGFSSLAYLKRFPVDALKIDRAFVDGLELHDSDDAFVRSIVSLAGALGLDVVAEGVENQAQADVLARLGCRRAQGYFFGRPIPAAELRSLVLAGDATIRD